jgi:hypothetical protein
MIKPSWNPLAVGCLAALVPFAIGVAFVVVATLVGPTVIRAETAGSVASIFGWLGLIAFPAGYFLQRGRGQPEEPKQDED